MTKLSVISTVWQRPQYLEKQVDAVINNSIPEKRLNTISFRNDK